MNERIYLTGFMGSGKTTVGLALAKAIGYHVIDTDQWIEQSEGLAISDMFQKYGEEYFRSLETKVLSELAEKKAVVTTGGGIILRSKNREMMNNSGCVVFLDCAVEEIVRRTMNDQSRPLLKNKDMNEIKAMYQNRLPLYKEATVTIDTTEKSILEIVDELKSYLLR
ncbi:shikimate kinase [Bacillus sp. FJAT-45037]|uniref:shikimate kinase n=1 Tax=Bacillus sp. FJAT-45037 TaxID=2011007 RepID=UPI000C246A3A|nr:shikimate kinase [Bacillus sp. FJAT-45037]